MVSIGKIRGVEQAVRYLQEAIAGAQIDYYAGRGEAPGRWSGKGAEALGLSGRVSPEAFRAVLAGIHPQSGEKLGRSGAQRVVAFDVTFSAPKDMTLIYALATDPHVRDTVMRIHAAGVRAGAAYLQDNAGWARQVNRETGLLDAVPAKLVMPCFTHRTARPVTDPLTHVTTVDPQLHTHIPIPNWVQRPDDSWSQLWSSPLYDPAAAAGAIAQAVWRDGMVRELGVSPIVENNGCFRIVGITEEQRREFSRRSEQIIAMEEAKGVDSLSGHKIAVTGSRQTKLEIAPGDDLFAEWRERGAGVGLDDKRLTALMGREPFALLPRTLDVGSEAIVGRRGLTEEAATFCRRHLIRAVAAHARFGMSRDQVESTADAILADRTAVVELSGSGRAEPANDAVRASAARTDDVRYSSPEMVGVESEMVATAVAGRGTLPPPVAPADLAAAIAARPTLTDGQRAMIAAICTSGDSVLVIEGAAGTGKTFALDACREALTAAGHPVIGCALAGRAAEGLEEESGIPSWTLARLQGELRGEARLAPGTVVIADEAGMIGSRQMAELVAVVARDHARLALVGDPHQLQPIDAGAAYRALGERLGRVEMTEVIRQQEVWERAALTILRQGKSAEALDAYIENDRVQTAANAWQRRTQIVGDFIAADVAGHDVVMVARQRAEAAVLNELARSAAAAAGQLTGPAITMGGRDFQQGDRVVCLANHRDRAITNGLRGEIVEVDADNGRFTLRTPTDKRVTINSKTYENVDYGYALTVHKAQGMTADLALVVGSDAMDRELAYTGMSRGRVANRYYEVDHAPERDVLGTGHWPKEEPTAAERIASAWGRSHQKDSTLDYAVGDDRKADLRRLDHDALADPLTWIATSGVRDASGLYPRGAVGECAPADDGHSTRGGSRGRYTVANAGAASDNMDRTLAELEAELATLSAERSRSHWGDRASPISETLHPHHQRRGLREVDDPFDPQPAEMTPAPEDPQP